MSRETRVAVFRPDDERLSEAVELLESLGATPVPDPMLAVDPSGETPESADWVVLTSQTGVELATKAGWSPGDASLACIGASTAKAARAAGWSVDLVPLEYSSRGLVEALGDRVAGYRVEVARSDHGSSVLLEGLREAGADVHETVLYRLTRPEGSGMSTERAARGELEAALFTSSLTVEHFLAAASEGGIRDAAISGLNDATVGAIGDPTRDTAAEAGIEVDIVPEVASFETLACAVVEAAAPSYRE